MTWSWNWLEKLWRDIRYGARTLTRAPGFAVIAVLVMALGIGATTSLFTIVRSVMLRPLPFRDPDKLVSVYEHFKATPADGAFQYNPVSPADYSRLARQNAWVSGHGGVALVGLQSFRRTLRIARSCGGGRRLVQPLFGARS